MKEGKFFNSVSVHVKVLYIISKDRKDKDFNNFVKWMIMHGWGLEI